MEFLVFMLIIHVSFTPINLNLLKGSALRAFWLAKPKGIEYLIPGGCAWLPLPADKTAPAPAPVNCQAWAAAAAAAAHKCALLAWIMHAALAG